MYLGPRRRGLSGVWDIRKCDGWYGSLCYQLRASNWYEGVENVMENLQSLLVTPSGVLTCRVFNGLEELD